MGLRRLFKHYRLIAVLWGFAEATLFFIVPDVWLSFVALHIGFRKAINSVLLCVTGAVAGGSAIYIASVSNPAAVAAAIDTVPAISAGLIEQVRTSLEHDALWAMFIGSLSGVPYKIFASQAATNNIELINFALATVPARAFRFVLVAAFVSIFFRLVLRRIKVRMRSAILASCWVVFYGFYFSLMPN